VADVAAAAGQGQTEQAAGPGLFIRTATGLVRGVPPKSGLIMSFMPGHPTQTMSAIFLLALAVGPGGNPYLALLLVVPMSLAISYAFGLLTQMIPRSGGDYMLVSRVLYPAFGLISSFCMMMANLLSNAFFGLAVVLVGISPLCVAVGLIGHHPGLVSWGTHVASSKGWLIFFGLLLFAFAGAFQMFGWKWTLRVQNTFFWMISASLAICMIIMAFISRGTFERKYNNFAKPFTHNPDSYDATIRTAVHHGVNVAPHFSFGATIPMLAVFATTAIFAYWSTFVGGELRQASTMKTSNYMALAGVIPLPIVAIAVLIFLSHFGGEFLRAANGGGLQAQVTVPGTPFFFLTGVALGSSVFTVIVFVLYMAFWPTITYIATIQQTRMLFAYSFDGILPKWIARVNRHNVPWVALWASLAMSGATFIWAVFNSTGFFKVLAYATLVQMIPSFLIGISAMVAPYRRRRLYQASASQKTVFGIPLMSIAGLGAAITATLVWLMFTWYDQLGVNSDWTSLFSWTLGPAAAGILFWGAVYLYKHYQQGIDITRVFAVIPPE
jgi:amino acid transporter